MEAFHIATELQGGTLVVAVEGELDMSTAPELDRALSAALDGQTPVVVDLTGCSFVDSSALNALVKANNRLNGRGPLPIVGPQPHVLKVLQMTHLEDVFEVRPTGAEVTDAR